MKLSLSSMTESQDVQNKIIKQLRDLIVLKNFESGEKLPSERALADRFEVSRTNVRDAIQRLEFYGILKSIPQSGTFISNIGGVALKGILDDIISLEQPNFKSLVETRIFMELKAVKLAAIRRTEEDLSKIKAALDAYNDKVNKNEEAVAEDLLFHLSIARASGNSTLNTLMLSITPEIITNFEKYHVCDSNLSKQGIQEHQDIYEAIKEQNPSLAKEKMKVHFKSLYEYCYH
ncbi:MAG: FadR/GntR family transcriptional regulator [Flavobacteriaceae bacterium]